MVLTQVLYIKFAVVRNDMKFIFPFPMEIHIYDKSNILKGIWLSKSQKLQSFRA